MKYSTIKEIINDVKTWELNEFTNASFKDVVRDVIYHIQENNMSIEEAEEQTNLTIMDGNL
jgi:hypothetical protein